MAYVAWHMDRFKGKSSQSRLKECQYMCVCVCGCLTYCAYLSICKCVSACIVCVCVCVYMCVFNCPCCLSEPHSPETPCPLPLASVPDPEATPPYTHRHIHTHRHTPPHPPLPSPLLPPPSSLSSQRSIPIYRQMHKG